MPALGHRTIKRGALVGMRRQPPPEPIAMNAREGRLSAPVKPGDRVEPGAAEEMGEVVPAVAQQHL